jgi:hypothetical protein
MMLKRSKSCVDKEEECCLGARMVSRRSKRSGVKEEHE